MIKRIVPRTLLAFYFPNFQFEVVFCFVKVLMLKKQE